MLDPDIYRVPLKYSADIYVERLAGRGTQGKSTWTDWTLIPTERLSVAPPKPKYNFVDIPGSSREMDLTESVTGFVNYGPRTGSWEFVIVDPKKTWYELYTEIMEFLQGQRVRVVVRPDMDFYYEGRMYVNEFKSNPDNSSIVLDYHFMPWKINYHGDLDQLEGWVWQPNYLDNAMKQATFNLTAGGSSQGVDPSVFAPTIPRFLVAGGPVQLVVTSSVWKGAGTYELSAGDNTIEDIVMMNGSGTLLFYVASGDSNAVVDVYYSDGHL